ADGMQGGLDGSLDRLERAPGEALLGRLADLLPSGDIRAVSGARREREIRPRMLPEVGLQDRGFAIQSQEKDSRYELDAQVGNDGLCGWVPACIAGRRE